MSLAQAEAFVRVQITDRSVRLLRDIFQDLERSMSAQEAIAAILRRAAERIRRSYVSGLRAHDATGNLAKSTRIKTKKYSSSGVVIAVVGPQQTGRQGATQDRPSGNHAWLFEFGSNGRRRPQTRQNNRRTYVNVHESVNRRMTIRARLEDSETFANRGRGYYFLMSSWREPTRQPRAGKGYTHDFLPDGGVFALAPGATYGAMPAYHLMENSISANASNCQSIIRDGLINAINNTLSRRGT